MFETQSLIRRKYYIISKDMDWFVQADESDYSLTSEIEVASSFYDKEKAFEVCSKCNKMGMNVKVVKIQIKYSMWNGSVTQWKTGFNYKIRRR